MNIHKRALHFLVGSLELDNKVSKRDSLKLGYIPEQHVDINIELLGKSGKQRLSG
ncbi:Uncharacterised protein [Mycobacteroides abscessus subsp. abscessus]|nr:Uncharacterised protein [Mycobacteroides abscessus subsp. abscessus]